MSVTQKTLRIRTLRVQNSCPLIYICALLGSAVTTVFIGKRIVQKYTANIRKRAQIMLLLPCQYLKANLKNGHEFLK